MQASQSWGPDGQRLDQRVLLPNFGRSEGRKEGERGGKPQLTELTEWSLSLFLTVSCMYVCVCVCLLCVFLSFSHSLNIVRTALFFYLFIQMSVSFREIPRNCVLPTIPNPVKLTIYFFILLE